MKEKLSKLSGKKHITFQRRGNRAILNSLRYAKQLGKTRLLIPDQGGWMTYEQYGNELGFSVEKFLTDSGLITDLPSVDSNCVLLLNAMPGYCVEQDDIGILVGKLHDNSAFVITDVSGAIGNDSLMHGDVLIGSFGPDKPLSVGKGGFIASDLDLGRENEATEDVLAHLDAALGELGEKRAFFYALHDTIIAEMSSYDIIHADRAGFNVIVRYKNATVLTAITSFCDDHGYAYTMCPRYIRVNDNAVSIEVKRQWQKQQKKL